MEAWGEEDEREDCSHCAVAAILVYSDTMCPALYSSVHVHVDGDEAPAQLEGGGAPSFHMHRFTFLLLGTTPSPLGVLPGCLGSQGAPTAGSAADGAPPAESGAAGGVPVPGPGARISALSASLYSFECEDMDLLEGHVAQLRQRIESPGSTWVLCSRFLHPLAAQCCASSAFDTGPGTLPALPPEVPLEALAALPLVHRDFLAVAAELQTGGQGLHPSSPAPAQWSPAHYGSPAEEHGGGEPAQHTAADAGGGLLAQHSAADAAGGAVAQPAAADAWNVVDSLVEEEGLDGGGGAVQGSSERGQSPQAWPRHKWEEAVREESQSLYALPCAGDGGAHAPPGPPTPEKHSPSSSAEGRRGQASLQPAQCPYPSPAPVQRSATLTGGAGVPRAADPSLSRLLSAQLFPSPTHPTPFQAHAPGACNPAPGPSAPSVESNSCLAAAPAGGHALAGLAHFPLQLAALALLGGPCPPDSSAVARAGLLPPAMRSGAEEGVPGMPSVAGTSGMPGLAWSSQTEVSAEPPLRPAPFVRQPSAGASENRALRSLFPSFPAQPAPLVPSPSLPCPLGLQREQPRVPPMSLPLAASGPPCSAPLARQDSPSSLSAGGAPSGDRPIGPRGARGSSGQQQDASHSPASGSPTPTPLGVRGPSGTRKRPQRGAVSPAPAPLAASASCFSAGAPCGAPWDEAEEEESLEEERGPAVRSPGKQPSDLIVVSADRLEGVGVVQLRQMFDRSITEAAEALGVGLTVLKKHCRSLGILRWPHRKIDSINKLILVFEDMADSAEKAEILEKLVQERKRIAEDPTAPLNEQIKMLRQAYFKASYKRRKACESP